MQKMTLLKPRFYSFISAVGIIWGEVTAARVFTISTVITIVHSKRRAVNLGKEP
jgi:hypothetical protein